MTEGALSVTRLSDMRDLAMHRAEWSALTTRSSVGDWFAGPDWIIPWLEIFGKGLSPAVYLVRNGQRLVGVVPLVQTHQGIGGSEHLSQPRNSHVRRIGWIADEDPEGVLAAVLTDVRRRHRLSSVVLPQVPHDSMLHHALRGAAKRTGFSTFFTEEQPSARVGFPTDWAAYVATRDGKLVRNIRRHLRRLSADDGWEVRCTRDRSHFDEDWESVLSIETRSWKHLKGSSIVNEPGTAPLYRAVAAAFADRSALRLWILSHLGQPVAHALAVRENHTLFLLKNSFDETYRAQSPGISLVWKAMEAAVEEGVESVDFLGDATEWKIPLATELPSYASWTLFSRWHVGLHVRRTVEEVIKPPVRRLRQMWSARMTGGAIR